MTDLSEMIRWNANFVRGLAQTVLDRAQKIRRSLAPPVEAAPQTPKAKKATGKKIRVSKAKKPMKGRNKPTNG